MVFIGQPAAAFCFLPLFCFLVVFQSFTTVFYPLSPLAVVFAPFFCLALQVVFIDLLRLYSAQV